MAENNNVCIITPPLPASNKVINLNISLQNEAIRIVPVAYGHQPQYVLMSKNGSVPDVILDKSTIDLILEARYIENAAEKLACLIKTNPQKYDAKILDDKKVITEILTEYANNPQSSELSDILHRNENTRRYILQNKENITDDTKKHKVSHS